MSEKFMIHEDPFYTWEKYYLATLTLARGSRPLEERLYDVWLSHLMGLKPEQFPVQVREKHATIYNTLQLAAKPMGYDMRGTCVLGELEERQLVDEILSVFLELTRMNAIARNEERTLRMMKAELGLN